jgi:hypothetical protein
VNYNLLPEHMRDAMRLYIEHRVPPGGFLTAVLSNDLMEACGRADHINLERLPDFCRFLYNYAPGRCYGSPEKVKAWLERRGRRDD